MKTIKLKDKATVEISGVDKKKQEQRKKKLEKKK